jgi:hypothetical protein
MVGRKRNFEFDRSRAVHGLDLIAGEFASPRKRELGCSVATGVLTLFVVTRIMRFDEENKPVGEPATARGLP